MGGGSSMFFNNFNNLGLVENRKKHESTGKKHFRDSLPDRQNGGFDEKKHEKHKKHPWLQKVQELHRILTCGSSRTGGGNVFFVFFVFLP
jgi:hypothetical protein